MPISCYRRVSSARDARRLPEVSICSSYDAIFRNAFSRPRAQFRATGALEESRAQFRGALQGLGTHGR